MLTDATLPKLSDPLLSNAMERLNCNNVAVIDIIPKPHAIVNECHNNVARHVSWYGGEQVKGYYIAVSSPDQSWVAIRHSVWRQDDTLVDITPVKDNRTCNIFIYGSDKLYTSVYNNSGVLQVDDTL